MAQVYGGAITGLLKEDGVQAELTVAAEGILQRAEELAAQHIDSDRYRSSLRVRNVPGKSGVRDRLVESTDPGAVPIEYGHLTRGGRYVPGQYILTRAIG